MMITGISAHTPIRRAKVQTQSFGAIDVNDWWVKEHCGLTDKDIVEINRTS